MWLKRRVVWVVTNNENGLFTLKTVCPSGLVDESYSAEDLARFQATAEQWRIIVYRSFSDQNTLKGNELLKAVYDHRKYAVQPILPEEFAICDGEICGVVKKLGCCDINGGAGGWKGFRQSVIYFSDSDRTLYDYNRYDYTYSTRDEYTYEAYALVPLAKLREIAPEVE